MTYSSKCVFQLLLANVEKQHLQATLILTYIHVYIKHERPPATFYNITSLVVAHNIATYFQHAIAIAIACAQADMSTLPSEPASDLDSRAIATWTLQGSLLAGSTVSSNSFNPFELSTLSTKLAFQATSFQHVRHDQRCQTFPQVCGGDFNVRPIQAGSSTDPTDG